MLTNEVACCPGLIRTHRTNRTDGLDVLVRCVYDDTSLSSTWHDLALKCRAPHEQSMLHGYSGRRDHQLARLQTNAWYRTTLLWAVQPLVAALRWPSDGRTVPTALCTGVHSRPERVKQLLPILRYRPPCYNSVTTFNNPITQLDFSTNSIEVITVFLVIGCNWLMVIPCLGLRR